MSLSEENVASVTSMPSVCPSRFLFLCLFVLGVLKISSDFKPLAEIWAKLVGKS